MGKFVEVHCSGENMMLNLDSVDSVFPAGRGSAVVIRGDAQTLDESYEEIKKLIGTAQGGIPMEPGRMYDGA